MPHYGRHGFDYWHQNEDGRLIVGGFRDADMDSEFTADGGDDAADPGSARGVRRGSCSAGRPKVTHRWAGSLRARPRPDAGRRPRPGRDGLWVAGGYSGHGNVLGLMCGDLVAQAIAGEPHPLLERMSPARLVAEL